MKIILDEELPMGKSNNYKLQDQETAPRLIRDILNIEGVKGVYHVADFLAVERNARFDWKEILPKVRIAFGEKPEEQENKVANANDHFGEIKASVQVFKGIPMQIKLISETEEKRFGLPDNFQNAVEAAQKPDDNVVILRKWKDLGLRYGDIGQAGLDVVEEIMAAYPDERLSKLVKQAQIEQTVQKQAREKIKLRVSDLKNPDWRKRYQLLEQMEDPELEDLEVLEMALADEKASIRRLATVYLGMIEDKQVLPLLYKALKDKTVTVRRTAGDCLSDLGFKEAIRAMVDALKDESKLVRWRAAMYLFEVGDESALGALKAAEDDPEFEVALQIKMAIERIEGGEMAKGSVWKQMTEARKLKEE